ncbi:MAG TPA: protein phosphatase 2C domain-containing protein [Accumulibacter sp.]|uniref:PP2C family protein-serine/threonine phosphatase n=1 Tax=Accumulibacter sp. TaxID=2053492 RepID=UPI002CEF4535|nr:protein phosphatase 2C domain-containing protein [Accumulibacter sp.]HMV05158.1 protein phosphatase 2C domain-containing protein [Accumulibacter sp.]HMW62390.1 protein phosphatase 2C domain-containing protein [Accumulibacter sp.]HMW80625.1 protein phosphatase 2C domain-containing protein [Accumulibacter sp.]HNB68731.1 protein phosphatase 2C domain-containing protein [Accumulibacter sp.]HNC26357.1 protein phosphatase 2C domain-containing protein [Accumulibacter sp.]
MPISIDACVAQHQGDRREQQDRVAILPHPRGGGVVLAVVADGMGGHTGGVLAAQQVIHTARDNLARFSARAESARTLLESCINEAHTLIRASRFLNEKEPHSTVAMLLLQPDRVSWAHCGDSRFYHFRGDQLVFRSTDHSYVMQLVLQGRITPEQALAHPNRNILLTSLGGAQAPKIAFGECLGLQPGDTFLLCSDGLWSYFSDQEFAWVINGSASVREASELLVNRARGLAVGDGDNISLAILRLFETPPTVKARPPAGTA